MTDRLAAASGIRVSPDRLVAHEGDTTTFTAVAADYQGRTIQGVRFTWESSDPEKLQIRSARASNVFAAGSCHCHLPGRIS